jgi:hypothetical protein
MKQHAYYGLFIKLEGEWKRLFPAESYTLETARKRWWMELLHLSAKLRPLPPVKQIDPRKADKKYAKTPW